MTHAEADTSGYKEHERPNLKKTHIEQDALIVTAHTPQERCWNLYK